MKKVLQGFGEILAPLFGRYFWRRGIIDEISNNNGDGVVYLTSRPETKRS